jgi:hypothetical protein
MPGLNRRGPQGEGPMTGRRMGRCIPENKGKTDEEILQSGDSAFHQGQATGRGLGYGHGRGLGFGRGFGRGIGLGRGMGFRRGPGFGRLRMTNDE